MVHIVDHSDTIASDVPASKTCRGQSIAKWVTHERGRRVGERVPSECVGMLNHVGPHVDAYYMSMRTIRLKPGGQAIDAMPLTPFMGNKAVCFDLPTPPISTMDVSDDFAMHLNVGLTAAATHWLADRGVRLQGVSRALPPIVEPCRAPRQLGLPRPRHHPFEWLRNLQKLVGIGIFQFQPIPLKFKQGSRSPVRALAIVD